MPPWAVENPVENLWTERQLGKVAVLSTELQQKEPDHMDDDNFSLVDLVTRNPRLAFLTLGWLVALGKRIWQRRSRKPLPPYLRQPSRRALGKRGSPKGGRKAKRRSKAVPEQMSLFGQTRDK
jgi:hypothetical protein